MSKLKAKNPQAAEPSKPKVLISGAPGVGKTWFVLDWPKVFYIDTEGGATLRHYTEKLATSGGAYLGRESGALDGDTIIDQMSALATERHDYKTVVIDSLTKLYQTMIAIEQERLGDKDAFGASKKPAIAFMRRLVTWIDKLDMNVIFVAHETPEWGVDNAGQRTQIGVTADVWDKLRYELHLWLHIVKRGPARVAIVRKSRLTGFPDGEQFPLDFKAFSERWGKDIIEQTPKPITLATPEQVRDVTALLDAIKLDPKTLEKWFTEAGVVSFSEMTTEQITGCISFLKKKIK